MNSAEMLIYRDIWILVFCWHTYDDLPNKIENISKLAIGRATP